MEVRCISDKKKKDVRYSNLTIGKKYKVLSLNFGGEVNSSSLANSSVKYRVLNDDGGIAIYPQQLFKITDTKLEEDWVIFKDAYESFSLLPESFAYQGFWEDFINHNKDARDLFSHRYPELAELLF